MSAEKAGASNSVHQLGGARRAMLDLLGRTSGPPDRAEKLRALKNFMARAYEHDFMISRGLLYNVVGLIRAVNATMEL